MDIFEVTRNLEVCQMGMPKKRGQMAIGKKLLLKENRHKLITIK